MAYIIINKLIPTSLYPLKATYGMTPEYITIHNTANDATAINEIAYMTGNKVATSFHVAIDDKHLYKPFRSIAMAGTQGTAMAAAIVNPLALKFVIRNQAVLNTRSQKPMPSNMLHCYSSSSAGALNGLNGIIGIGVANNVLTESLAKGV